MNEELEWTSAHRSKDEAQRTARRKYRATWLLRRFRRRAGLSVITAPPTSNAEVLDRLTQLPLSTWTYGWDDDTVKHLGPMAQDFAAAFGLGDSDIVINCVDANGVAMAAIQELQKQIVSLRQEVEDLKSVRNEHNDS